MTEVQQVLTSDCGHHCGVITTGSAKHIGHCPCVECHNTENKE